MLKHDASYAHKLAGMANKILNQLLLGTQHKVYDCMENIALSEISWS
jgi:hypothetical protein